MKNKKTKHLGGALLFTLLGTQATHAGLPSVHKNIPDNIRIPVGISAIAALDDANSKIAATDAVYYLPLNQEIEVNNTTWSPLVTDRGRRGGFCQFIDDNKRLLNALRAKTLATLTLSPAEARRIDELLRTKRDLEAVVAERCATMDTAKESVDDLKELLEGEKTTLTMASATMGEKIAQGMPMAELNAEIRAISVRIVELTRQVAAAQTEFYRTKTPCETARRKLTNNTEELASYNRKSAEREELELEIDNHRERMVTFKDKDGHQVSGGSISGIWDDGYLRAKIQFDALNPHATLKRLPQKQLNFYIRSIDQSIAGSAFLMFSASGNNLLNAIQTPAPTEELPRYENANNEQGVDDTYFSLLKATPFRIDEYTTAGTSGAYDAELSVFGACAILEAQERGRADSGLVISSTSLFPSSARTKLTAKYNMYKLIEQMEEKGTKKTGFLGFDKEAFHNAVNKAEENSDFSFEYHTEDVVDAAQQAAIRTEVKAEMMTKLVLALGSFNTKMPDLSPEPAATTIQQPIRRIGFLFNIFPIQIFDFVTLFGDTKTKAELKTKLNFTAEENWDYNRIVPQVNTISINLKFPRDRR